MFLENKKMSKVSILHLHNQLNYNKEKEKEILLSKSSESTNKINIYSINHEHSPNMTLNEIKETSYYRNNLTETDTVKKIRNTKHMANILNKSAAVNHFKKIEIPNRHSSQVSIDQTPVTSNQNINQSHVRHASIINLNSSNANLNRSKSRIRINAYSSKENNLINSSPNLTNKTLQYKKIRNISLIQPNNISNMSTINNKEANTTKNKLNSVTLTNFKPNKITNTHISSKNLRDNSLGQTSLIKNGIGNGNGERSNNSSVDKKKFIFKAKYTKKVELEKNEKHMINKFMDKMLNLNLKNNK
jgi:hypothetical protein